MSRFDFDPGRRLVLAATAGVVVEGVLSACGASGETPASSPTAVEPTAAASATPSPTPGAKPQTPTEVYLPTWLDNSGYDAIGQHLAGQKLDVVRRVHLSFAEPTTEGIVGRPDLSEGMGRLLDGMPDTTSLSIAIGGASTTPEAWKAAFANPEKFGGSVEALRAAFEQLFKREVHVDFDFELEGTKPSNLTRLVAATRKAISAKRQLSMAVPAGYMLETFDTDKLKDLIDGGFHVMTYDLTGPWDDAAGPIASGAWDASSLDHWVTAVGAPNVELGLPTYGYRFRGAHHAGDAFKDTDSDSDGIAYTNIPAGSIKDNMTALTSEGKVGGDYVSCLSPGVIHQIVARAFQAHPDLRGTFFWDMSGLTPADLDAIRQ